MEAERLRFEREQNGDGEVVTLWLSQAERPVVVLDSALLRSIDGALDTIEREVPKLAGLVLTSDSRVFVAGANLKEIMELDDPGLHEYLEFGARVFGRFATMPCTTVAAINGAALGGGLEIAMHCDRLLGALPGEKEYRIGLPEAGLSICPGWGGTNLLPARMNPGRAIAMTATGETLKATDAAREGLLEQLVDPSELLEQARSIARAPKASARPEPIAISNTHTDAVREALGAERGRLPDTQAARAVAACVEVGLETGWDAATRCERESLSHLRSTEEGRGAIEAFFAKTASR